MRAVARLSALGLALAASAFVVSPAMADEPTTGVVFGSAWIDSNGDGVRQPGEPPMVGYSFLIPGDYITGRTDENGNYRIENVPAGTHTVTLFVQSWETTFTKSGRDSDFDQNTRSTKQFTLAAGGEAGPFDAGFVPGRFDVAATRVDAPRFAKVGDEVDVKVTYRNKSNAATPLYGTATLPAGLTPLSHNAPAGSIDGQTAYLSSVYQADTYIGESVTYTVKARVDAPIDCGEIVVTADTNGRPDANTMNNVKKATISAS
ncbi:SdrD B-like domain-containing protein [Lentzea sp. NPDC058450]|uniref:SdrD B-like domain-containing protein n=1 Tax=Lentzea sp. NPDC058450 TaxID=3346505 RepID=UPI00365DDBB5